jgi:hypothetical protein
VSVLGPEDNHYSRELRGIPDHRNIRTMKAERRQRVGQKDCRGRERIGQDKGIHRFEEETEVLHEG